MPVYYNGYRAGEEIVFPFEAGPAGSGGPASSAGPLGIGGMAERAVQGRAVLIDLQAHLGTGPTLVDYNTLAGIMDADGACVEQGDIVCLHTGFAEEVIAMGGVPEPGVLHGFGAVLDGLDPRLLEWVTASGVAAIAADNYAVEKYPAAPGDPPFSVLPLHRHCLFKLGIHLGELWRLSPLAAHLRSQGRSRFLLTAPPLNLPGAAGSPVTPVATV